MAAKAISMVAVAFVMLPLLIFPMRQLAFLSQSYQIRTLASGSGRLERMVFTTSAFSQLNFTRGEREFIYHGNMYDVKSIARSWNQVVVTALWDKTESEALIAFQPSGTHTGPLAPGQLKQAFMPYFHVDIFRPVFKEKNSASMAFHTLLLNYTDPYPGTGSPPPEILI